MPRTAAEPKLVLLKKKGFKKSVYYIRYRKNGNKTEITTHCTGSKQAKEYFEVWLAEFYRTKLKSDKHRHPDDIDLIDLLLDYAEEHAPTTAAPERIAYAIEALNKFWMIYTVDDITPELCKEYANFRKVSDWTVRRELGVLKAALNHARKNNRLAIVPHIQMPSKPDGKDIYFTRPEMAALLNAARTPQARLYLPLYILLSLYTGGRKAAILELKWDQVDFKNNRIDLNPKNRKKTTKGRAVLPISRRLQTFLNLAYVRGGSEFVIHRNGNKINDIKKGFAAACKRAGIENATPHTIRHTTGTWMAQAGVPMFEIAKYLGHSHERTSELYAHHHPDFLKSASNAFG